jgi:hypothetical protein
MFKLTLNTAFLNDNSPNFEISELDLMKNSKNFFPNYFNVEVLMTDYCACTNKT